MCQVGDVHANKAGYGAIAQAFINALPSALVAQHGDALVTPL
jgi:hypothetical protein